MNQSSALETAFFNDGYRIAGEQLDKDVSPASLFRGVSAMYAVLDAFIAMFLDSTSGTDSPAHCRRGCSWCCHQAVFAETHTLDYLKHWIAENLSSTDRERFRQAASNKHTRTKDLGSRQRLRFKYPCPLLQQGECMAYAARPLACRIYLSSNVGSCEEEFRHPEDNSIFPQLFSLPLQLGRKLNEGFYTRLDEMGSPVKELPLEEGLLSV